jgi:hypothetical protein
MYDTEGVRQRKPTSWKLNGKSLGGEIVGGGIADAEINKTHT